MIGGINQYSIFTTEFQNGQQMAAESEISEYFHNRQSKG